MNPNDYFKEIAIAHKDIAHTDEAPAYFREYSSANILFGISDFINKLRYTKSTALISQFNKDGNYFGPNTDQFAKDNTGTIYIIKKVDSKSIGIAYDETYEIWKDILTKIRKDEDEGLFLERKIDFRYKQAYVHSLGMIADGFFGIAIFLSCLDLQDGSPLVYDPDRWS